MEDNGWREEGNVLGKKRILIRTWLSPCQGGQLCVPVVRVSYVLSLILHMYDSVPGGGVGLTAACGPQL